MDARYVLGLRETGYTKKEMELVFKLQQEITAKIRPEFAKIMSIAKKDWEKRIKWNGFLIIKSKHGGDIRSAISQVSIYNNADTVPMIISINNGEKISVQNVSPEIVNKLKENIKADDTYSFGSGRCWGVDNKNHDKKVNLEEIVAVLK
jgi:hypothetical protein